MAFCKTPPFLEGAQLSQLSIDSLTCTENHLEADNDQIMSQVNTMFGEIRDNFTMVNSSVNVSHEIRPFGPALLIYPVLSLCR